MQLQVPQFMSCTFLAFCLYNNGVKVMCLFYNEVVSSWIAVGEKMLWQYPMILSLDYTLIEGMRAARNERVETWDVRAASKRECELIRRGGGVVNR